MAMQDRKPTYPPVGKLFGNWKFTAPGTGYNWIMTCTCGVVRSVRSQDIRQKASTSCGCMSLLRPTSLGGFKNKTHGVDYGSKLYRTWRNAKNRCYNPNAEKYLTYGALGITMCDAWVNNFPAFAAYVGEPPSPLHSLDRKDNTKGYEPENVRWATVTEQARNKRSAVLIAYKGDSKTPAEWSELTGLKPATILYRYRAGWPEEFLFVVEGTTLAKSVAKTPRPATTKRYTYVNN